MWTKRVHSLWSTDHGHAVDGRLLSVDGRYGITGTTGLTPFVVVVGSNNFLPVPVCLLTRSETLELQWLDFLLR